MDSERSLLHHYHPLLACLFFTITACVAMPVSAEQILWRSDTPEPDMPDHSRFGDEIDIEGNLMAIAAPASSFNNPRPGAVYFFERQDGIWREVLKLTAPDAVEGDMFGDGIAMDGEWIAITVGGEHSDAESAVHVFRRGESANDWQHVAELDAAGPVAMSGRRLVTGGNNDDIYLYERDDDAEWSQVHAFVGQEGTHWNPGGVSIDGDTVVIGTHDFGALVYEYNGSNWLLADSLQVYDEDETGPVTVATEDDVIVIGAPFESFDERGLLEGRAHVYERQSGNWNHVAELGNHEQIFMRRFGSTLHFQDGIIIVGEPNRTSGRTVYMRDASADWQRVAEMSVGLHETVGTIPEVVASASTFARGMPVDSGGPKVAVWPFEEWLEEYAVEGADIGDGDSGDGDDGNGDDGNSDGDGGTGGDDTGDDTGGDDTGDDAGTGDDDPETVTGGDDDEGTGGDDGDDGDDGDETGGSGGDDTSEDEPPATGGGGGGAAGTLLLLPLAFLGLLQSNNQSRKRLRGRSEIT